MRDERRVGKIEWDRAAEDAASRFSARAAVLPEGGDKTTGVTSEVIEPCAAARQLRYLFGKYVHVNGAPKRSTLDRKGILSSKSFHDPEDTLRAAVRHGYLVEEARYRDRVKRSDGDVYSELVANVREITLSEGISTLLDDLCAATNCSHVPTS